MAHVIWTSLLSCATLTEVPWSLQWHQSYNVTVALHRLDAYGSFSGMFFAMLSALSLTVRKKQCGERGPLLTIVDATRNPIFANNYKQA